MPILSVPLLTFDYTTTSSAHHVDEGRLECMGGRLGPHAGTQGRRLHDGGYQVAARRLHQVAARRLLALEWAAAGALPVWPLAGCTVQVGSSQGSN